LAFSGPMPTHVLIVEGDAALSARMRSALQQRGHTVEETSDGRACLDLARRSRAGVVVLGVELPGGQNGYLLCGKFKKDEELKNVPIIIVGNADGFAAHRKLKNRAEEYLLKPLQFPALVAAVDHLSGGGLAPALEEEITVSGDPDLDLIDAAFDESPRSRPSVPAPRAAPTGPAPAPVPAPASSAAEEDFSALASQDEGPTQAAMAVTPAAPPEATPAPALAAEASELGGRLAQLQAALDDAQARAFSGEVRAGQLEAQLDQMQQELAAARRDLELNRAHAEGAERELESLQQRAEAAETELQQARQEAESAGNAELAALQARVAELELAARKHEERVARLYARLKSEERAREKARKALAVAGQLLGDERPTPEPASGEGGPGEDEPAAA
jgi:CheY-like chemotaxis protein